MEKCLSSHTLKSSHFLEFKNQIIAATDRLELNPPTGPFTILDPFHWLIDVFGLHKISCWLILRL